MTEHMLENHDVMIAHNYHDQSSVDYLCFLLHEEKNIQLFVQINYTKFRSLTAKNISAT